MSNEIFRKKSLDRMRSPEELNDYIRVLDPGVWLLMAAVIILLAGVCIWGIFGNIETTVNGTAYVENGTMRLYIAANDSLSVQNEVFVRIGDTEFAYPAVSDTHSDKTDGTVCIVNAPCSLRDGIYTAEVITERIKPMSFLFN